MECKIESDGPYFQFNLTEYPTPLKYIDFGNEGEEDEDTTSIHWIRRHFKEPPPIGSHIRITGGGLGTGVIQGYFIKAGYLGIRHHQMPWFLICHLGRLSSFT